MLVDHLIYAVPELTAAVADVEDRFGVRAQPGSAAVARDGQRTGRPPGSFPHLLGRHRTPR